MCPVACRWLPYTLAWATIAIALPGCGEQGAPTGNVSGSVTFQGEPVTSGHVVFENGEEGRLYSATIAPDGTYEVLDLERLEYVVSVMPREEIPVGENAPTFDGSTPMKQSKGADPKNIPEAYRSPFTSPLRYTVESEEGEFPIELTP